MVVARKISPSESRYRNIGFFEWLDVPCDIKDILNNQIPLLGKLFFLLAGDHGSDARQAIIDTIVSLSGEKV